MIKSRIKPALVSGILALFIAVSAHAVPDSPVSAAPPSDTPADTGRDAAFLPPPSFDALPTASSPASSSAPATATPAVQPVATPLPVVSTPAATPSPQPVVSGIATPVAPPTPSRPAAPVPAAIPAQLVDLGKPVQASVLTDIDPESIGLFSAKEGGLGAAMWKDTQRSLVDRLMPDLALPSISPLLNDLAQRFLLTTADVPAGKASQGPSLIALRVNALISLGDIKDAWKLVTLAKPEQIDDDTYHRAAEFMLTGPQSAEVCAKLPDISKQRAKADWQELLLVCQLMAKDTKAAQLTLDLMHAQEPHNDTLIYLAERNIIAGAKELPRQLTPLKPLTLALLQQIDLPLRPEVYAHPDPALIPAMLQMKTKEDLARLTFAEKTGERGIITAADLEAVYASILFPPEAVASAESSTEAGTRLHALLYQAAMQEKQTPEKRVNLAVKFLQGTSAAGMNGDLGRIAADMIGTVQPAESYNSVSASIARIYIMANNPQLALAWLKQAKHAAIGMPGVATDLQNLWPLAVLTGLETDTDYGQNLGKWLDAALKTNDPKDDSKIQREHAGSVLMLLDAAGYAVPDEDWAKVLGVTASEKHVVPSAALLERLRAASVANRRGETVLYSLLLSGANVDDPSLLTTLAEVRALRLVGLTADASLLAREAVALIITPPPGKS